MRAFDSCIITLLITFAFASRAEPPATRKATTALVIVLMDADTGQPITSGATLTLREDSNYKTPKPVDNHGRAMVDVPQGASYVSVLCRKEGYATTSVRWENEDHKVPVELPAEQTVKLPKGKSIGGRVVDEAGKPIQGAKLTISFFLPNVDNTPPPPAEQPVIRPVIPWETRETDADGRWLYGGGYANADRFAVHVQHPDYARDTDDFADPPIQSLFDGSAVKVLERGVEIAGSVSGSDGRPIAGARVSTVETRYVVNDYGVTTKSDAAGKFRLAHVANKKAATLTVTAAGHAPEMFEVDVRNGPPLAQAVVLAPGKTIRGRVVDSDGKPLEGVELLGRDWRNKGSIRMTTKTDKEGKFVLRDAPADEMQFHVIKDGYAYRMGVPLTASDDESHESVVTMTSEAKSGGL